MSASDSDNEFAKQLAEVRGFLVSLGWAKQQGLEAEFMISFLQDYAITKDIASAVWFADCEWDL
jgi:hypothetical protein